MLEPQISWFVEENDALVPHDEYYAGSYRPSNEITLKTQVWNNRWGQSDAKNAESAYLAISFDTYEDSALLNLCKASVNGGEFQNVLIEANKGIVALGTLTGYANNGLISDSAKTNYRDIELKIGPLPANMQDGVKNMFLNVEYNS